LQQCDWKEYFAAAATYCFQFEKIVINPILKFLVTQEITATEALWCQ
jgi:hypothetical protein